jgi:hypothetical protein
MDLICRIAGHRAETRIVENEGRRFSRCVRCRVDLVESSGRWSTAPRGYRIVWKEAELLLDTPSEEQPRPASRPRRKRAKAKAPARRGKSRKAKTPPPPN